MQYPFEEIYLMGEGLHASGTATLESAGSDYPGEFYVTAITFDKGPTLSRDNMLKNTFNRMLFDRIASEIEASDGVAKAFLEEQQGMRENRGHLNHRRRLLAYTLAGHPVNGASLNQEERA